MAEEAEPRKREQLTLSERIQRHTAKASKEQEILLINSLLRANYRFLMGEEYLGDPNKLPAITRKLLSPKRFGMLIAAGIKLTGSVKPPERRIKGEPYFPYREIEPFLAQAFREQFLEGEYKA